MDTCLIENKSAISLNFLFCGSCRKIFVKKNSFKAHYELNETDIVPYTIQFCNCEQDLRKSIHIKSPSYEECVSLSNTTNPRLLIHFYKRCVSSLLGIHSPLSSLRLSVCLVSHKPSLFRTKESPLNKWNITTKQIHVSGCMYLPQWFFSHILLYNCVSKVIFIYNNIFGQIQKLKT